MLLVTTRAVSARHKLNSLANLRDVQSSLAFSIPTGYSSGTYGVDSLRSLYRYPCARPEDSGRPAERVNAPHRRHRAGDPAAQLRLRD